MDENDRWPLALADVAHIKASDAGGVRRERGASQPMPRRRDLLARKKKEDGSDHEQDESGSARKLRQEGVPLSYDSIRRVISGRAMRTASRPAS